LGRTKVWLLTSVLDPQRLTTKAMVRFYKMRWGIEVEFRGLKQTLDRAKLRCRNPQRLLAELDWLLTAAAGWAILAAKGGPGRHALMAAPRRPGRRLAAIVRMSSAASSGRQS